MKINRQIIEELKKLGYKFYSSHLNDGEIIDWAFCVTPSDNVLSVCEGRTLSGNIYRYELALEYIPSTGNGHCCGGGDANCSEITLETLAKAEAFCLRLAFKSCAKLYKSSQDVIKGYRHELVNIELVEI